MDWMLLVIWFEMIKPFWLYFLKEIFFSSSLIIIIIIIFIRYNQRLLSSSGADKVKTKEQLSFVLKLKD